MIPDGQFAVQSWQDVHFEAKRSAFSAPGGRIRKRLAKVSSFAIPPFTRSAPAARPPRRQAQSIRKALRLRSTGTFSTSRFCGFSGEAGSAAETDEVEIGRAATPMEASVEAPVEESGAGEDDEEIAERECFPWMASLRKSENFTPPVRQTERQFMQRTQRALSMEPFFKSMHPEGQFFTQSPHFTQSSVMRRRKIPCSANAPSTVPTGQTAVQ